MLAGWGLKPARPFESKAHSVELPGEGRLDLGYGHRAGVERIEGVGEGIGNTQCNRFEQITVNFHLGAYHLYRRSIVEGVVDDVAVHGLRGIVHQCGVDKIFVANGTFLGQYAVMGKHPETFYPYSCRCDVNHLR